VVLFTSGSESLPKAVPLTHANLLANLRDIGGAFPFDQHDRLIGILPPFHSFGLTATVLLPLCGGVPVVYHPNPTEGAALARTIEAYGVTLLVGTPTFLGGILRSARGGELDTLRAVISGAEKCPEQVFEMLHRNWPRIKVVEGYGITECSPVVTLGDIDAPRPGTVGRALPSVEYAIVDLESGKRVDRGKAGMLLVRGASIFGGYLNYEGASPFVEFDGRSWYRTGDLVSEDAAGVITFAGRLKRFIKLGGEMVSLPAIEEVLARHYARPTDEEPVLAVEATPVELNPELVLFTVRDLDREEVNARIKAAGLSPIHNIRLVRKVEKIPTLGTGKTDYRMLKEKCL
jgi:long-chain-fatty-acid--[acyl-carrier-protein] ligase